MQQLIRILEKSIVYPIGTHLIVIRGNSVSLPGSRWRGGEYRPYKRNKRREKFGVFRIKGPSGSWDLILKNGESFPSCIGIVTKTQKVIMDALHNGSDRFSLEACALSSRPGREIDEMLNRVLRVHNIFWSNEGTKSITIQRLLDRDYCHTIRTKVQLDGILLVYLPTIGEVEQESF